MFNDIGLPEVMALVVLAVLVFGPDKLPQVIQDVARTIRKIREFSDSAKQDIREELGPEFKDFEFEDLNPKTFIRKQLDSDDMGLKEIRNGFDLKKEMAEVSEAVSTVAEVDEVGTASGSAGTSAGTSGGRVDMQKRPETERPQGAGDPPPFDSDAT
ncbi:sec-independent translocase [Streptomyces sp. NPDC050145]|uniref:sec-independent translocase n=1 Tax=Streptomyces sp. NPDC050145 TaxID=3365602 RepID=UPI0037B1801D